MGAAMTSEEIQQATDIEILQKQLLDPKLRKVERRLLRRKIARLPITPKEVQS